MNTQLAMLGGPATITHPFKQYNPIGEEEVQAAKEVIESGVLSQFIGAWHPDFLGGPKVKEFEAQCASYFGVKHAITVNSWTSGLIACVGAIGIQPGDEVIVPPWTMCASATAILHWNAIPVFADIELETFCICPKSIEKNITKKTKAIIVVDIFGHPANYKEISKIAKKYNLKIICDAAQSPGSKYFGKYSGTVGDIGGFSFNYHKHIHTGEGGVIVTNNKSYAKKMKLIRNHAEAVVLKNSPKSELVNMLGHNFRMGEIEAAIGIQQLAKLNKIINKKKNIANLLINELSKLRYIKLPIVKKNCTHVFYAFPIVLEDKIINKRDTIIKLLNSYGLKKIAKGYQNLHLQPIYQKKICYGKKGFPWSLSKRKINYKKGICPNAEKLHSHSFLSFGISFYDLNRQDVFNISKIFKKTWSNIGLL